MLDQGAEYLPLCRHWGQRVWGKYKRMVVVVWHLGSYGHWYECVPVHNLQRYGNLQEIACLK